MDTEELYTAIRGELAPKEETREYQWATQGTPDVSDWDKVYPPEDRPLELSFTPDDFQRRAFLHIRDMEDVFVAAHTSAGKTVTAEWAIAQSLKQGRKAIYTSPIKALSNQKFRDFTRKFSDLEVDDDVYDDPYDEYDEFDDSYGYANPVYQFRSSMQGDGDDGDEKVGIITGDVQVNKTAPCLIVTTEILRAMIYDQDPTLEELDWVVFDEIHYMNDPERGRVWEEVITLLPSHIRMLFLSATTPNALDFSEWVGRIKQRKVSVVSTPKRPIPLEHFLHTGTTERDMAKYYKSDDELRADHIAGLDDTDLTVDEMVEAVKAAERMKFRASKPKDDIPEAFTEGDGMHKVVGVDGGFDEAAMDRALEVCEARRVGGVRKNAVNFRQARHHWINLFRLLRLKNKFPVVVFVFSKKACVSLTTHLAAEDYTSKREKSRIRVFIDQCLKRLKEADRDLPQIRFVRELVMRGIAVHHGGLLPLLKEMTEILFARGLLRVLFATETFAMGINMPTRCVIFNSVSKHDGTDFRNLLPGEYTQMSGRAGRRGLDDVGTVVVLNWKNGPVDYKRMISGKPLPLVSRFHLTYQTILSVLHQNSLDTEVTGLLRSSFSEFRCGRDRVQVHAKNYYAGQGEKRLGTLRKEIEGTDGQIEMWRLMTELERRVPASMDALYHQGQFVRSTHILVMPEHALYPDPMEVVRVKESHLEARYLVGGDDTIHTIQYEWVLSLHKQVCLMDSSQPTDSVGSIDELITLTRKRFPFQLVLDLDGMDTLLNRIVELGKTAPTVSPEVAKKIREYVWLERSVGRLHEATSEETLDLYPDYHSRLAVLRQYGYITEEEVLTLKGRIATRINTCHELVLAELLMENGLEDLEDAQVAALLSCLVYPGGTTKSPIEDIRSVDSVLYERVKQMRDIVVDLGKVEVEKGMDVNPETYERDIFGTGLVEVVYHWASGEDFCEIMKYTDVQEGNIVRAIMRLDELCQEIVRATTVIGDPSIGTRMERISALLRRDIVFCGSLYV